MHGKADISVGAFFTGRHFTTALVMRILVLGAVFANAALFGLLTRPRGANGPGISGEVGWSGRRERK